MTRFRTTIFVAWTFVGLAVAVWGIWLAVSAYQYFHLVGSAAKSSVPLLLFALASMAGSTLALHGSKRGELTLQICSSLCLLYAIFYFMFGGLDDAQGYLPGLGALIVLSVATLARFLRASVECDLRAMPRRAERV